MTASGSGHPPDGAGLSQQAAEPKVSALRASIPDAGALLPCPFCGVELQHVESWARSFSPPRLYHEYHHDNEACVIGQETWSFDDQPPKRAIFIMAWNTRPDAGADFYAGLYADRCGQLGIAHSEIKRLREALQFYADPYNWSVSGEFDPPSPHSLFRPDAGDTARDALAQGIETGTAETEGLGAKHESPVAEGHAPVSPLDELQTLGQQYEMIGSGCAADRRSLIRELNAHLGNCEPEQPTTFTRFLTQEEQLCDLERFIDDCADQGAFGGRG